MNNDHKTYVFYYTGLSEDERKVYMQLLKGLQEHVIKCTVDSICTSNQIGTIIECIRFENPIIGYFNTYTLYSIGKMVCAVEFNYHLTKEKQAEINTAMIEQAAKIVAYARSKGTEHRKQVRAVHEYLVRWEYDHDFNSSSFSPAGVLLYGKSVCMGVALAYKLILDMLQIPSICVSGEHDGEGHAWNLIYYNGEWHFHDATFDLCQSNKWKISYKSFEKTSEPKKYKAWEMFPLPKQKG